mmetsp:Transcript_150595/g.419756  ORF Transcript_150595/g.419756 Transcript_150595/m.419756 type:complete len:82 (+) Transcript_150595:426-671(+)
MSLLLKRREEYREILFSIGYIGIWRGAKPHSLRSALLLNLGQELATVSNEVSAKTDDERYYLYAQISSGSPGISRMVVQAP